MTPYWPLSMTQSSAPLRPQGMNFSRSAWADHHMTTLRTPHFVTCSCVCAAPIRKPIREEIPKQHGKFSMRGAMSLVTGRGNAAVRQQFGRKRERQEDIEKDAIEQQQLALSAQNFALKTVIRALVDHARASDPQINDRLNAAIDARHAGLGNVSDTDLEFTEKAIAYLSLLTTPPE
ncbi:hypothetical protein [Rhizobium ruizarguesonis]|uniref:hypothetical protein n=1 Tax=Rhizobium ruizarguesonis TaxID=2081791 RepID=UPI001FE238C5|nr:hypothetical protein [Rhizobium ruizarguesonis]